MSEDWIPNASPIIALAKIERLDLLTGEGRSLFIPKPVVEEIRRSPMHDAARMAIESGWGGTPVEVVPEVDIVEWGLGPGESAVLSLARAKNGVAIVDDRAARTACKALNIRFIGTLGVVLRARKQGRIASAADVLKALSAAGLFLERSLIQAALQEATGEKWTD